jgi:hypothetical protein
MTSVSETLSTLNFGRNVTEITLGAAKKNAENGAAWEAKERAMRSEREAAGALGQGGSASCAGLALSSLPGGFPCAPGTTSFFTD